jgi:hypothetical protein
MGSHVTHVTCGENREAWTLLFPALRPAIANAANLSGDAPAEHLVFGVSRAGLFVVLWQVVGWDETYKFMIVHTSRLGATDLALPRLASAIV